MRSFGVGAAIAATSLFFSQALADVDPIVIKGSKFFYKTNGTQFYIRGVAYQQNYGGNGTLTGDSNSYTDPLADGSACNRDIPYLQQLRTNTIRVYAVDPTKSHDDCMNAFANAGIYVLADLSEPNDSINRDTPSWNVQLYSRYTSVIDAMAGYSNTLGFFAGNEVSNSFNTTAASAFVRASVRDSKAYIASKNYRALGVGYASDDDATIRDPESNYLNCDDQKSAIDFWGYNIYEWCSDQVDFSSSGYKDRTAAFANYSVPVFFAEYGCNTQPPRKFGDTPVLFGSEMQDVWSGGIVFEYFQGSNNYGLVTLSGSSISTLSDFNAYSSQIASVSPSGVVASNYSPSNSPRSCPATGSTWAPAASPLPPSPNAQLCSCMYNSLSCVVKPSVNTTTYGDLFGYICGTDSNACNGINTNVTVGSYGAYGMCNATEQLSWALNQYYQDQGSAASNCDFQGSATIKSATSATGGCSSLVAAAGTGGQGTVTGGAQGTGAGGSAASSTSKPGAANSVFAPTNSYWQIPALVSLALLSGAGMVLL